MIEIWSILDAVRRNHAAEGADEELAPLCAAAAKELEARIKDGADCTDIRLINACAAMVNYRLCLKNTRPDEAVTSFKAGDVTVSISPSAIIERAEKEKSDALIAALPLLRDDGFVFRQVSI
ncbi:MAG: hypothetical protein IJZ07_08060 [Clostridia bacterium]|nr:hypothetical protein [Clostridia bacterium]